MNGYFSIISKIHLQISDSWVAGNKEATEPTVPLG